MVDFFADNFANSVVLAVLLMAMIPTLESKVAIPFGLSVAIWGEAVLSPVAAFFVAWLGRIVPAIFVIMLARYIRSKTSGFVHEKFMNKYGDRVEKANSKGSVLKKCMWLTLFVAIPLPLTGVWSGSLIAGFLDLKIWQAFLSVAVGAAISCTIVLLLCLVFANSTFYIFLISLIMIALWGLGSLLVSLCRRAKAKKEIKIVQNVDRIAGER